MSSKYSAIIKVEYHHDFIKKVFDMGQLNVKEALQNKEKQLKDIEFALNESSIVAITDRAGKITFVNDVFCKLSKYTRDELMGQDHRIINANHHPKSFFRDMWKTIGSGKVWKGEIKNLTKDGTHYWVDTTIVPMLDKSKKPYQYVSIRHDITNEAIKELVGSRLGNEGCCKYFFKTISK
jgi:PAS domain S-box-containing protein